MPKSQVLHPLAGSINIHFKAPEHVEDAVRLFDADPVLGIVALRETHLLFPGIGHYTLCMPGRAEKRVRWLLENYEVTFASVEAA
jgi:hypothetical protein